jgi:hypothetical protein
VAGADYFYTRNLLPTWPALALVLATGFGATRVGRTNFRNVVVLAAISILCVVSIAVYPEVQRADWRGAARALGEARDARAIVSYVRAGEALQPYAARVGRYPPAGARIREADVISLHGSWVGRNAPLRANVRLPGFEIEERLETSSYTIVRYRSRVPRLMSVAALRALYPGLPSSAWFPTIPSPSVLLQTPCPEPERCRD